MEHLLIRYPGSPHPFYPQHGGYPYNPPFRIRPIFSPMPPQPVRHRGPDLMQLMQAAMKNEQVQIPRTVSMPEVPERERERERFSTPPLHILSPHIHAQSPPSLMHSPPRQLPSPPRHVPSSPNLVSNPPSHLPSSPGRLSNLQNQGMLPLSSLVDPHLCQACAVRELNSQGTKVDTLPPLVYPKPPDMTDMYDPCMQIENGLVCAENAAFCIEGILTGAAHGIGKRRYHFNCKVGNLG